MLIAWTTLSDRLAADEMARGAVAAQLAVCVQVDGPVTSFYTWQGRTEKAEEYRLMFKVLPAQVAVLEAWVHAKHPYQVPEWVVVNTQHVSEKYLSWALSLPSN